MYAAAITVAKIHITYCYVSCDDLYNLFYLCCRYLLLIIVSGPWMRLIQSLQASCLNNLKTRASELFAF